MYSPAELVLYWIILAYGTANTFSVLLGLNQHPLNIKSEMNSSGSAINSICKHDLLLFVKLKIRSFPITPNIEAGLIIYSRTLI